MHMASDMFSRSCRHAGSTLVGTRVVLELDGAGEPFSRVVCDVSVRCYRVGEVFGCTSKRLLGECDAVDMVQFVLRRMMF